MNMRCFKDRFHAGRLLAGALQQYASREDTIVLGMPRGGVPVAYEVASRLQLPLDVIVVRKLGVPGYEELAMGAIASGGILVINEPVVRAVGVPREIIDKVAEEELQELRRREIAYRGHGGAPEIRGRMIILVDDGIATGSTIHAAIKALREQAPARIIVAVPTAPRETCAELELVADEVVCLKQPQNFGAVGLWYEDFTQTSDAEVASLLEAATRHAHKTSLQPQTLTLAGAKGGPMNENG